MYPDFVAFRRVNGHVVVDIVDPHDPSRDDAAPKWPTVFAWAKRVNAGEFDIDDILDGLGRRPRLGRAWAIVDGRNGLVYVDLLKAGIGNRFVSIAETSGRESAVRAMFADRGALV